MLMSLGQFKHPCSLQHPADERDFWNCLYQRVEADSDPFQEVIDNITGESFPMTLYSASRVLTQAMHEQSAVAQLAVREREAFQNNERLAQMQGCVDSYREAAETSLQVKTVQVKCMCSLIV